MYILFSGVFLFLVLNKTCHLHFSDLFISISGIEYRTSVKSVVAYLISNMFQKPKKKENMDQNGRQ